MTERVIVFAAHPDDETLGCGATIARHTKAGDPVSVVVFADGLASRGGVTKANIDLRHGMCRRACKILGTEDVWLHQYADNMMDNVPQLDIVKHMEIHLDRFKPTVVYTHWANDLNVDHGVMHRAVNVACRPKPGQTVKQLYYFEVPCSTSWGEGFEPDYFVEAKDLGQKLAAAECYSTELLNFPHPRSMLGIEYLARWRGATVGVEEAEAFKVGRIVT